MIVPETKTKAFCSRCLYSVLHDMGGFVDGVMYELLVEATASYESLRSGSLLTAKK